MNLAALASLFALVAPQNPWTREEMTADLDQLVAALRERWAYCEDRTANNGLDLDALRAASLAALEEVRSKDDFAIFSRRQNAAPVIVLGWKRAKIRSHSLRLRRTFPSACLRIAPSSEKERRLPQRSGHRNDVGFWPLTVQPRLPQSQ